MTTIRLPRELTAIGALSFAAQLAECDDSPNYTIDASALEFVEPFGMLLCASALRRLRLTRPDATRVVRGMERTPDYAAHMGFWKSFGATVKGRSKATGRFTTYLPITVTTVAELQSRATRTFRPIHAAIDDVAGDMADVLVQDDSSEVNLSIQYCLRELIRNVVEHSGASEFWYCAQYWPSKDIVELALLDEGRGFLASLSENTGLSIRGESEAIKFSVGKGVSRVRATKAGSFGWSNSTACVNSGYGLYALSQFANADGSLLVVSNNDAVRFEARGMDEYMSCFRGAAIRLKLRPSMLSSVRNSLREEFADETGPSASLSL